MSNVAVKRDRTTAKQKFTYERRRLLRLMDGNNAIKTVIGSLSKVNELWKIVEEKHDSYIQTLDSSPETEDHWLLEIRDDLEEAEEKYKKYLSTRKISLKEELLRGMKHKKFSSECQVTKLSLNAQ